MDKQIILTRADTAQLTEATAKLKYSISAQTLEISLKYSLFSSAATQKLYFLTLVQNIDQKVSFSGMIDHKAIQAWTKAYCQTYPSGQRLALKTTQAFLKSFCELCLTV